MVDKTDLRLRRIAQENKRKEIASYFYPFYQDLHERLGTKAPPTQLGHQFNAPPSFRSYPHPRFSNKVETWTAPPLVLDPSEIPNPTPEPVFHSALFRFDLTSAIDYLDKVSFDFPLQQGSLIVFRGFNNVRFRHIVEWCQWTHGERVYLKVTGLDHDFNFVPYNDPYFPSFILILPIRFVNVPVPYRVSPSFSPSIVVRGFEPGNQESNVAEHI